MILFSNGSEIHIDCVDKCKYKNYSEAAKKYLIINKKADYKWFESVGASCHWLCKVGVEFDDEAGKVSVIKLGNRAKRQPSKMAQHWMNKCMNHDAKDALFTFRCVFLLYLRIYYYNKYVKI